MNCRLENREDLILKYLMNELSEEESRIFEEHYFLCDECFRDLRTSEDALGLIRSDGAELQSNRSASENQRGKKNRWGIFDRITAPVRWGFSFASLVLIFFLIYSLYFTDNKDNGIRITAYEETKDPSVKNPDDLTREEGIEEKPDKQVSDMIAEFTGTDFEVNPYYEELINENVRSSGSEIIEKVLSPAIGDRFTDKGIDFAWTIKFDMPVELRILNNSEELIFSSEVNPALYPEVTINVEAEIFKKSGLYYWRIESENEVFHVGKFYFLKQR